MMETMIGRKVIGKMAKFAKSLYLWQVCFMLLVMAGVYMLFGLGVTCLVTGVAGLTYTYLLEAKGS